MISIVTDTAVSLPQSVIDDFQITLLGGHLRFGTDRYADYFEMKPADFYARLETSPDIPTYEDPQPDAFKVIYRSLLQRIPTADILSIHCTGRLSTTIGAARVAAVSFPNTTIRLFDTLSVGAAQGLMVWEAAKLARDGMLIDDIIDRLSSMRDRTRLYFTLNTLEFVKRSGRVGRVEQMVGDLLEIKPILTLHDGSVETFAQYHTRTKALEALRDMVIKDCLGHHAAKIGVMHAACETEAQDIADDLQRVLHPEIVLVSSLGAGVGASAGPGALGVSWYYP